MCTGLSLVNLTQAAAVSGMKDVIYWSKISWETTKSQYGEAMFNKIGQRTVFFSLKHVWRGTLSIALNHQLALVLHCTEMILKRIIPATWHWVRWSPFICKLTEVVYYSLSISQVAVLTCSTAVDSTHMQLLCLWMVPCALLSCELARGNTQC